MVAEYNFEINRESIFTINIQYCETTVMINSCFFCVAQLLISYIVIAKQNECKTKCMIGIRINVQPIIQNKLF